MVVSQLVQENQRHMDNGGSKGEICCDQLPYQLVCGGAWVIFEYIASQIVSHTGI